jgi:DNA-binding transcriptional regulator YdaS (Cro superfamily)
MIRQFSILIGALLILAVANTTLAQESEFFDSRLSQWDKADGYWEYKEGVLIAAAPEGLKRANRKADSTATNLISKKSYSDFELAFKIRIGRQAPVGIPGLRIRGNVIDAGNHLVAGPLVAWENGGLYGARGGLGTIKRAQNIPGLISPRDFNDFKITAIGKRVTIVINGTTVIDETISTLPASGVVAWSLTGHSPSDFLVRDIRFRDLSKDAKPPAAPEVKEPAKPARLRYSRETIELFGAISGAYGLNDQSVAGGDIKAAARLAASPDANVRQIASHAIQLHALRQLRTEQGRKTLAELKQQIEVDAPLAYAKRLITSDTKPGVAELLEDLMGSKVQDEFNKAYLLTLLSMDKSAKLRGLIQTHAQSNPPTVLGVNPVAIFCETTPQTLGSITIRNDSGRTLHKMVLVGRLAVDAEAAKAAGKAEDAIGRDLLPAIGFSKETVEGSRLAGQLRALAAQIDPGNFAFVPEVKPGGSVRISISPPRALVRAKSADLSVFCDELTVVSQRPSNFFEAQVTAMYPPQKKVEVPRPKGKPAD